MKKFENWEIIEILQRLDALEQALKELIEELECGRVIKKI